MGTEVATYFRTITDWPVNCCSSGRGQILLAFQLPCGVSSCWWPCDILSLSSPDNKNLRVALIAGNKRAEQWNVAPGRSLTSAKIKGHEPDPSCEVPFRGRNQWTFRIPSAECIGFVCSFNRAAKTLKQLEASEGSKQDDCEGHILFQQKS